MTILNPELTIILKPEMLTMAESARVDAFVKLECGQGITLEHNAHVASFTHLNIGGGKLTICEGAAVASGGKIITGSNMLDAESCSAATTPAQQRIERWEVTIGKNATIFAGGIAMSDLGEGACLAANGFLPRNTPIPAFEIWGGTPARKIGERHRTSEQIVKLDWDGYFDWHARNYRHAPEYIPTFQVVYIGVKVDETTHAICGEVFLKNKSGKETRALIPMQFITLEEPA